MSVSVVMPSFNAERTVEQAIASVLSQTYREFELIVVDDCSTDGTYEIAARAGRDDKRVRLLRNKENQGVARSRNIGVQAARFEWVAFLDSDDMWRPEKLEKQVRLVGGNGVRSICFTGSTFMDEDARRIPYELSVPGEISRRELLKQNLISCSSVLVKKETLLQYPMHGDAMIHEDLATWLKILEKEDCAVGLNEPLLVYRVHKASKSGNKLHAAEMQWRTYRYVGISMPWAAYYFLIYTVRSLRKYSRIHRNFRQKTTG